MIIGLLESGEVKIYENLEEVMQEWGQYPEDILSDVIIFYDEEGNWLQPIARYTSNKWFKWWERLVAVDLVKSDDAEAFQDSLAYMLNYEATTLEKNSRFKSLDELKAKYPYTEPVS